MREKRCVGLAAAAEKVTKTASAARVGCRIDIDFGGGGGRTSCNVPLCQCVTARPPRRSREHKGARVVPRSSRNDLGPLRERDLKF